MSVPLKGKVLPNSGKELHRRTHRRRRGTEYSMAVSEALKIQVNNSAHATKKLMRWTGASERTVKGWLAGANGPCGEHLIELMSKSDEVWDGLRRLAKRPSVDAHHLVALRAALEVAMASIDAILEQRKGKGGQN
jgi:hypothetical protein